MDRMHTFFHAFQNGPKILCMLVQLFEMPGKCGDCFLMLRSFPLDGPARNIINVYHSQSLCYLDINYSECSKYGHDDVHLLKLYNSALLS